MLSLGVCPYTMAASTSINPFLEDTLDFNSGACTATVDTRMQVVTGDLDGNGVDDIVVSFVLGGGCSPVSILFRRSDDTYTQKQIQWANSPVEEFGAQLKLTDLDADRSADLLITTPRSGNGVVSLLLSTQWSMDSCELPTDSSTNPLPLCETITLTGAHSQDRFGYDIEPFQLDGVGSVLAVLGLDHVTLYSIQDVLTEADPQPGIELTADFSASDMKALHANNIWNQLDGFDLLLGNSSGTIFTCPASNLKAAWPLPNVTPVPLTCNTGTSLGAGAVSTLEPLSSTLSLIAIPEQKVVRELAATDTGSALTSASFDSSTQTKGIGASAVAADFDGDGEAEVAIASVDTKYSYVTLFSRSAPAVSDVRAYVELMQYSDAAVVTGNTGTRLGSALAILRDACSVESSAGTKAAPGLLIAAPGALNHKQPALVLVCPQIHLDRDGDGSPVSEDCNDKDASVAPTKSEVCDGLDNDCDDLADDATWYPDGDGDGYGSNTAYTGSCPPSSTLSLLTTSGDCDDKNPLINPSAIEYCDGNDNDCDGQNDEGFDPDLDGYSSCNGKDCDPLNGTIYPGAPEICDGEDNNCDEIIPASETTNADGDAFSECLEGEDCDKRIDANPDATEVCNGRDDDCNRSIDDGLPDQDSDGWNDCIEETIHDIPDDNPDTGVQGAEGCASDPARNPGKGEECDGIDNDCDTDIDEGYDADGDGQTSCAGDCNDFDAEISSEANELCNGVDDDCDGANDLETTLFEYDLNDDDTLDCLDDDQDGMLECAGSCVTDANGLRVCTGTFEDGSASTCDCNDLRAEVFPGAPESTYSDAGILLADGLDNNCDGTVDENTGASDDDRDGYCELLPCLPWVDEGEQGDEGVLIQPLPGDCNDALADVHPGAPEGISDLTTEDSTTETLIADGLDNNCNGLIDEGTTAFDDDGDGYCDLPSDSYMLCARDSLGTIPLPGDCDDTDPRRAPTFSEGDYADGLDNDCNTFVDDGTLNADDDGDEFCDELPCVSADGEPTSDLDGNDCNDADPEVFPGALELANEIDDDCDELIDEGTSAYDDDFDGWCEAGPCVQRWDGYLPLSGDCNDDSLSIHPEATEVACDGINQDCDPKNLDGSDLDDTGLEDECDHDGDGYLESGRKIEPIEWDCDDTDKTIHPGAPEKCGAVDENCNGRIDDEVGFCPGCSVVGASSSEPSSPGAPIWALIAGLGMWFTLRRKQGRFDHRGTPRSSRASQSFRGFHGGLYLLGIVILSPLQAVHAQTRCTASIDKKSVESSLLSLKVQLKKGDYVGTRQGIEALMQNMPCLTERLDAHTFASTYVILGVASWYQSKNAPETRRNFRAALVLDSTFVLAEVDPFHHKPLEQLFKEEYERVRQQAQVTVVPEVGRQHRVYVDGKALVEAQKLFPGPHLIQVEGASRGLCTWILSVPVLSGQETRLSLRLESQANALEDCRDKPVFAEPTSWAPHRTGLLVTGGLLGLSLVSGVMLQGDYNALQQKANEGVTCSDSDALRAQCAGFEGARIRTWALIGATAAAAGVTTWLSTRVPLGGQAHMTVSPTWVAVHMGWTF